MISRECISYWIRIFFAASVITAVLLLANAAHCSTGDKHPNSLGVLHVQRQPVHIRGGSDDCRSHRSRREHESPRQACWYLHAL